VLDLKRPWFIIDIDCSWELKEKKCKNKNMADQFNALTKKAMNSYETIFENDGFLILRKKSLSNKPSN